MFHTKEINNAGCYLVYFYINGIQKPVIVDDYLPCKGNRLVFASSREHEVWVSILEKAWAKLHGNYSVTEGGFPCFASIHLTGVPSTSIRHKSLESVDGFWNTLLSADKRSFTMIAASQGQGEVKNDSGVISGHAYSVISIHEFNHKG